MQTQSYTPTYPSLLTSAPPGISGVVVKFNVAVVPSAVTVYVPAGIPCVSKTSLNPPVASVVTLLVTVVVMVHVVAPSTAFPMTSMTS